MLKYLRNKNVFKNVLRDESLARHENRLENLVPVHIFMFYVQRRMDGVIKVGVVRELFLC